ncbi:MAG TPA: hypothetical protein VG722_02810 [Tepidisphaeraceae bacterium]|nr:hypothetical protein [Tepidisphaeraceae bacterium]
MLASTLLRAAKSYRNYSLIDSDISFLGRPDLNPAGWKFWSFAMGITAFMLWPVMTYLSGRIAELYGDRRRAAALASVTSRFPCVGLLGLALIPQYANLDWVHQISGVLALGGLYLAIWFYGFALLFSSSLRFIDVAVLFIASWWGPLGFLSTQGFRFVAYGELGHSIKAGRPNILLRFSLWEWMLLFCVSSALIVFVLLLPKRLNNSCR